MPEVVSMGEALIDFVPRQVDCPLEKVSDFHRAAGGAPANVAVGLARMGIEAGFMGKVGDDAFGRFLREILQDNNVDITQMVVSDEAMTTLAFVSLQSDGERDFAFYRDPGADMLYRLEEIDLSYLDRAEIFHFGSISLIAEPSRSTTLELIKYAGDNDLIISFDPNLRPPLWDSLQRAEEEILRAIPAADVIKLNEEELEFLTDKKVAYDQGLKEMQQTLNEACEIIFEKGPEMVIVTMGNSGCFYYTGTINNYLPGKDVEAVDTTGAGDGFTAAVLTKLVKFIRKDISIQELDEEKLIEIFEFANRVGALTTTRYGGIPSLPIAEEL